MGTLTYSMITSLDGYTADAHGDFGRAARASGCVELRLPQHSSPRSQTLQESLG